MRSGRLVGEAVDDSERLGEGESADADGGVRVRECLLGERPCRRVDVQGDDGGGVEERRQPRTSPKARSRRTPLHTATGAPRRAGSVRRGGTSGSGGDEGVDRHLSGGVLDRSELCDRPATGGDDETVPAGGTPQVGGEVAA